MIEVSYRASLVAVIVVVLAMLTALGTGNGRARAQTLDAVETRHGASLQRPTATPFVRGLPAYPSPTVTPEWAPPETSDIRLSLQAPAFARRGESVRLAYTVRNAGPQPARGVTLVVVLPSGLYLARVATGFGWECDVANYAVATLNRPVTVMCWRDAWFLVDTPETVTIDAGVTTSVLSRDMVATRAVVLSKGVDLSPNFADWWPGVE